MIPSKFKYTPILIVTLMLLSALIHVQHYDNKYRVITWDGYGYYLYLPASFIYHDFSELKFKDAIQEKYNPTEGFYQAYKNQETQKYVFKYPCGMAILWAPFFGVASLYAKVLGFEQDGFSTPYQLSILIANLVFAFIGLLVLHKTLRLLFNERITVLTMLIIALGTNYFNQAAHSSAMTHVASFMIFSIILNITFVHLQTISTAKTKWFVFLGLLIGLATIIRPTNLLIALVPSLYMFSNLRKNTLDASIMRTLLIKFCMFCIAFILAALPQLLYWKMQSGSFLFYSYESEEGFNFFKPFFYEVFFSYRKGWLLYTPVIVFALVGFVLMYKKNRDLFIPLFVFFVINTWVICSWRTWWYGGNFGQRPFVESYSLLAFSLAYFLQYLMSMKLFIIQTIIAMIILLFVGLNQFQTWQYVTGMYSTDKMNKEFYWRIFSKTHTDKSDWDLINKPVASVESNNLIDNANIKDQVLLYNDSQINDPNSIIELNTTNQFSNGLDVKVNSLELKSFNGIKAAAKINCKENFNCTLVVSFERDGKSFAYTAGKPDLNRCKTNDWCSIEVSVKIPEKLEDDDILKVYVYFTGKGKMQVSNLEVYKIKM